MTLIDPNSLSLVFSIENGTLRVSSWMNVKAGRFIKTPPCDDMIRHVQAHYQHVQLESATASCTVESRNRHTEVKSRHDLPENSRKMRPAKAVKNFNKSIEIVSIFLWNFYNCNRAHNLEVLKTYFKYSYHNIIIFMCIKLIHYAFKLKNRRLSHHK